MVARLWSSLAKRTKAKYTKQGVTPQRYNAWNKKTKEQKRALKAKGVDRSGFLGLPPKAPPAGPASRTAPNAGLVATRATHMLLDDGRPAWAATILRNALRMTPAELRKAHTISADQWATFARKQVPENVWFYHK